MAGTPKEIGRNAFDAWCWRRGLGLLDVVEALDAAAVRLRDRTGRQLRTPSHETVRLIRLPFTDPRRRVPSAELMELIHELTEGEIYAGCFYPERLRGEPGPAVDGAAAEDAGALS